MSIMPSEWDATNLNKPGRAPRNIDQVIEAGKGGIGYRWEVYGRYLMIEPLDEDLLWAHDAVTGAEHVLQAPKTILVNAEAMIPLSRDNPPAKFVLYFQSATALSRIKFILG